MYIDVANVYEGGLESSMRLPKVMDTAQAMNMSCLFH